MVRASAPGRKNSALGATFTLSVIVLYAMAPAQAAGPTLAQALTGGKPTVSLRLRYEDVQDVSDWGRMKARIGRIAAVKE